MKDSYKKPSSIFYGWWIVVGGFIMAMFINGFINFSITSLLEPINDEFGWGYALVSLAASIRGLEAGIAAPLIGLLMDRFGPRKLAILGGFCIGLGLLLLGRVDSLAMFYLSFVIIAIGSSSCIGVVPLTTLGYWFRRRITLATGILVSGTAIGGLLIPVTTKLIDAFDWRVAVTIIGLGAWVILLPLAFIFRHKPEQYGYLPDGIKATDMPATEIAESRDREVGAKKALSTRAFWHITIGFTCHITVMNALITHIMPFLGTIGIDRSSASFMAIAIPVISIIGRLGFGWMGDKFDKKRITSSGMLLVLVAMALMSITVEGLTWIIFPALVFAGIGYGGPVPMMPALLREHFGRLRLGTLLGITLGLCQLGGIASPPLVGLIYDYTNSYTLAWLILGGVALIGMISLITTPAPERAAS